jgi:hypothetical protein
MMLEAHLGIGSWWLRVMVTEDEEVKVSLELKG